eukprot:2180061-Pleurochrysis_carterae.AAC.1
MSGTTHSGAWRAFRKIGDASAPRSAGCSRMYSAPAACATFSRLAVRRTISFACSNSRRCTGGMSGKPMICSLSLTGGGPPSVASALRNRRETEKVEQGGDAMTAA